MNENHFCTAINYTTNFSCSIMLFAYVVMYSFLLTIINIIC